MTVQAHGASKAFKNVADCKLISISQFTTSPAIARTADHTGCQ